MECNSNDQALIESFIKKSKIYSEDYKGTALSEEEAFSDFTKRIQAYSSQYERVTDSELLQMDLDERVSYIFYGEFGNQLNFLHYKETGSINKRLKDFLLTNKRA